MFIKAIDDWTREEKYINLNYCRVIAPYGEEWYQAVIDDGYDKDTFYIIREENEVEKVKDFLGIPKEKIEKDWMNEYPFED